MPRLHASAVHRTCWCGSESATPSGSFAPEPPTFDASLPLVRCDGCGVWALWPAPSLDMLERAYGTDYYGSSRRKFVAPVARAIDWFQQGRARFAARHVHAGARVLDIGCGNGGFLRHMQLRSFDVHGTEWTPRSAARVSAHWGIPVHSGDLLTLDLPRESFDLITLWHVFEHVPQPRETLVAAHALLRPGGTILLALPNAESWQAQCFGLHWLHWDPPRHLFGFGPRSLRTLLNATGFAVQSLHTFSLEQNPFGFMQSALNALGLPRDRLYDTLKGTEAPSAAAGGRIIDTLGALALAIPALVFSTAASVCGRGATMTVRAAKRVGYASPR